jgi:hypothetical protein
MIVKHHTAIFLVSLMLSVVVWPAQALSVTNVVLVHGAFVDGSGWQSVFDLLVKDGYHISVVQQPCDRSGRSEPCSLHLTSKRGCGFDRRSIKKC